MQSVLSFFGLQKSLRLKILALYLSITIPILLFIYFIWYFFLSPILHQGNLSTQSISIFQGMVLGLFIIGLVFTVLTSLVVAEFIKEKVLILRRALEGLAEGHLNYRVDLGSHDELELLASTFNKMGENLEKRTFELERQKVFAEGQRNQIDSILNSVIDGFLALDFKGNVFKVNPAILKMFSLTEEDVLGKHFDRIFTIASADGAVEATHLLPHKQLTEDIIVLQKKGVTISTNNKEVYANITSSAIKEGKEMSLGALVVLTDLTKEKELEEMKLDFVSMAAHELRTPITSVRGYLSVLLAELPKKITSEEFSFLDKAFISSTQLSTLVENLLSVSRIERGNLDIQTQETNWQDVVNEAYTNFLPLSKERRVELIFHKSARKVSKVLVDRFRISEVLSNLIANALNYTLPGGKVEIKLEQNGNEVVTSISDTGPGIPETALPKLFTKFFRVSGILEQGSKGTGLGLYISKAIVDMHKGKIWVESEVGKGSTFKFSVPASTLNRVSYLTKGKRTFVKKKKKS